MTSLREQLIAEAEAAAQKFARTPIEDRQQYAAQIAVIAQNYMRLLAFIKGQEQHGTLPCYDTPQGKMLHLPLYTDPESV